MHGSEMGMGNAFGDGPYGLGWCSPCLDQGLSALLTDLHSRGLLERTLVVVMGEFGRTPKINQPRGNPGRQHWPACWSAILAGGGVRGGAVYGETDKTGSYVKDRPVPVQDLGATIYHALDVPLETRLGKDGGTRAITTGQPIKELTPIDNEIVLPKSSSGVFNSTNIDYVLKNMGIRYLIVSGVVTDQCVDMAVRDGQVRIAPALFNTADEVDRCLEVTGRLV